MILLDKSEYDKVVAKMAADGFFKRLEEKYAALEASKKLTVTGSSGRPVAGSAKKVASKSKN